MAYEQGRIGEWAQVARDNARFQDALRTEMTLALIKPWTLEASVSAQREVKIITTNTVESVYIPRLDLWPWAAYRHSATNPLSPVY